MSTIIDKCIICDRSFNSRLISDDTSLWNQFILHMCEDCGMAAIEFRHYQMRLRKESDK